MATQSEIDMWRSYETINLQNFTIIIPSVAVGNVAQLACDLLISSLNMKKIASLYSKALVPTVGYDPYDIFSKKLMTSCELYASEDKKLAVLQIRSPLIQKYGVKFLKDVICRFRNEGVDEIVILTSSHAYERKHVATSPFRYLSNEFSTRTTEIKKLGWLPHETEVDGKILIHGGSFSSRLYTICCEEKMPTVLVMKYSSEGDNIPDGYDMIGFINGLLNIVNCDNLVEPVSWKFLFGCPPPDEIY